MAGLKLREMNSYIPKVNEINENRYKSTKRKSILENDNNSIKRQKLNNLKKMDKIDKNNENNIADSLGTSDSPFADSLNSNICQIDDGSIIDYICNNQIISEEKEKKYRYKVTEIYQIGFQVGESERIYVPNVIDSQDVSYPYESKISLTEESVNNIWNNMTPMILGDDYRSELNEIQTDGINQLEKYLSLNLLALKQRSEFKQSQYILENNQLIIELRKSLMKLIKTLWPKLEFKSSNFDEESIKIDYFLERIISLNKINNDNIILTMNYIDKTLNYNNKKCINQPSVSLYRNIRHHLNHLRDQSLCFIKMILPQLQLPQDFKIERDINQLIERICSVN